MNNNSVKPYPEIRNAFTGGELVEVAVLEWDL
uniref:Uncharacterized protein n=1 Tax=Aegilops tauschii subsp. strangulata TaxID=200361 RepID=A0A453SVR4_AEGTS